MQITPVDKYTPAQLAALRLLARGDYSLLDITNRLIKKGFDPIEVNQDLELLVNKKWINDQRVAENIWEYYKGQKGEIFIRQKMQLKQIPRDIINNFFENLNNTRKDNESSDPIDDNESSDPIDYKTIKRKLTLRYSITNWNQLDPKIKNNIYGYLARQGFGSVGAIMRQLTNPD